MDKCKYCLFLLVSGFIVYSCHKPQNKMMVSTGSISQITTNSAKVEGEIIDLGEGVSQYGHCYGKIPGVSVLDSTTRYGIPTNLLKFTSELKPLKSGTKYYVKAYLSDGKNTAYGKEVFFTTQSIILATLTTNEATLITSTTASSGGNVTDAGNGIISSKGVCWATNTGPIITDDHTSDGAGSGSFTSSITNLKPNTTYYLRAYATNSAGTNYGGEVTFSTFAATDIDMNNYSSVTIGTQIWMKENLKTTKYNDGITIPLVDNRTTWFGLTTPAYCWYSEDEAGSKVSYGALYNWYAVDAASNGYKNICPTGWHIPTDSEWTVLLTYLGGDSIAGGKLKEIGDAHWQSPNTGATNESGFTALPGGEITNSVATPSSLWARFRDVGLIGHWWSTTESQYPLKASGVSVYHSISKAEHTIDLKGNGWSVRCLKDY